MNSKCCGTQEHIFFFLLKKNTHYRRYLRISDVKNTDVLLMFSSTLLFIRPIVVNIQSQERFEEIPSDLV